MRTTKRGDELKGLTNVAFGKLALTAALIAMTPALVAQTCVPLQEEKRTQLEAFVTDRYKLPPGQVFTITDNGSTDSACYRKLVFRPSTPTPLLRLYLAPHGKHLVTGVIDLTVDPLVAQRKKRDDLQNLLTSGALLTSGENSAPAKMVVFSDFECPYCKRFADMVNQLTPEERSDLQITYRQLPLNIHPWAKDAAALGACVALQDKTAFWKLHDFIFSEQREISKESLQSKGLEFLARNTAVDTNRVASCLAIRSSSPRWTAMSASPRTWASTARRN